MDRKLVGVILLVLASGGCRMCSDCCDDLPPVLDGPYTSPSGRVGSAYGGMISPSSNEADEIITPDAIPMPVTEAS